MKLTIEVSSQSELEKIMQFFQTLKLESVRIISDKITPKPMKNPKKAMKLTKGDKSLDPTDLFGIWENNPRSVEAIRQQAWQRNTNL
jgi:hypothetical protein